MSRSISKRDEYERRQAEKRARKQAPRRAHKAERQQREPLEGA